VRRRRPTIGDCLFLVVIVLFAGCAGGAWTSMTSQVNSEVRGRSFGKVLIHGKFQDLGVRQLAEERICTELAGIARCECLKSCEVFFPGEEYTDEQIANRLSELKVDAVLTLQETGSGTSSKYIPQWSTGTVNANVIGNSVNGSITTTTHGGYNVSLPWANYEVILRSTSDNKVAWYATALSGGSQFANWHDLINSASIRTASELVSDGVLQQVAEPDHCNGKRSRPKGLRRFFSPNDTGVASM